MIDTSRGPARHGERGSALVAVLLLLMMMTTLAAALSIGSQTESLIARNENASAEAQAAAEAGLNHAVELAVTYIFEFKSNGFSSATEAVDALLAGPDGATGSEDVDADNMSLGARAGIDAGEDIPLGELMSVGPAPGVRYTAIVMDDDDSAPAGPYAEDGDPYNDLNNRLIVRATGYVVGADGTEFAKVTLEATIGPFMMPAVVAEGDVTLDGTFSINGPPDSAAVHTNSNLTIDGNSGSATGTVTATGEVDSSNGNITASGGAARIEIPPIAASDYEVWADYKLRSDGTMLDMATGAVCTWSAKTSCNNWDFNSATGTWTLGSNSYTTGTYYVEGDATISGSPGTAKSPVELSVIAEGNIDITGSPKLTPDTPELLFVTDKDLKITGNFDVVYDEDSLLQVEGQMLVHEQVEIGGNVTLAGQIVVEDAANTSSLVTWNHIHGGVLIEYGGTLGTASYSILSWRDVRDDD